MRQIKQLEEAVCVWGGGAEAEPHRGTGPRNDAIQAVATLKHLFHQYYSRISEYYYQ